MTVKRYNVVQRWLGHDHAVLEREYVDHGDSVDATDYDALRSELDEARRALRSIANNTCCGSCQEAAKVALSALPPSRGSEGAGEVGG